MLVVMEEVLVGHEGCSGLELAVAGITIFQEPSADPVGLSARLLFLQFEVVACDEGCEQQLAIEFEEMVL
jgi:hypothetical protein